MSATPAGFVSVAMPLGSGVAMGRRHSFTASRRGLDPKRATSILVGPSSRTLQYFATRFPARRSSGTSLRAYGGRDMKEDKKEKKGEEYKDAKQKAKMEAKAAKGLAKMEAKAEKEKMEAKAEKEKAKMEAKAEKEKGKMEAKAEKEQAKMEAAKMEEKAEKEKEKLEAKAAKEQAKMEARAEKEKMEKMKMRNAEEEPSLASSTVAAMQELLEFQRKVHEEERSNWRAEREASSIREERLLGMVDTLSGRLAEMTASTASVAPSTPPAAAAAAAPVPPPPSTPAAPQQPPAEPKGTSEVPAGVPEPVLGGRGILDVMDAIEEVNNRFRGDRSFHQVDVEVKPDAAPAAAAVPTPSPAQAEKELQDEAEQDEAEPAETTAEAPDVEVVDTETGQPPELKRGDDDIYWVNQLQAALLREGMYCGEEEMEEWIFGHHTQEALLTIQAIKGLPETGVCDLETWEALLGPGFRPVTKEEMPFEVRDSVDEDLEGAAADASAADDMFAKEDGASKSNGTKAESNGNKAAPAPASAAAPSSNGNGSAIKAPTFTKWPVLRLDDGGAAVHHLQSALEIAGFACDEDEMRWWMYGDTTQMSVEVFQACNGLTETGIVDEHTWKKLLNNPDATPEDISSLVCDNSYDEDLSQMGDAAEGGGNRVWLVGEQRWSNPTK